MSDGKVKIQRVLISVSDKDRVVGFAQGLLSFGVEIVSTGGTSKELKKAGIPVIDVSDLTGFPEMFDGRIKTLHPRVHGGLLYIRGNAEHEAMALAHGIKPIDMIVVNLYPFEKTVARPGCTFAEAIENIDIGGPTMLRAAAKNHAGVAVVVDPNDYGAVIANMRANDGCTTQEIRRKLAIAAFAATARYDAAIEFYLRLTGCGQYSSK